MLLYILTLETYILTLETTTVRNCYLCQFILIRGQHVKSWKQAIVYHCTGVTLSKHCSVPLHRGQCVKTSYSVLLRRGNVSKQTVVYHCSGLCINFPLCCVFKKNFLTLLFFFIQRPFCRTLELDIWWFFICLISKVNLSNFKQGTLPFISYMCSE